MPLAERPPGHLLAEWGHVQLCVLASTTRVLTVRASNENEESLRFISAFCTKNVHLGLVNRTRDRPKDSPFHRKIGWSQTGAPSSKIAGLPVSSFLLFLRLQAPKDRLMAHRRSWWNLKDRIPFSLRALQNNHSASSTASSEAEVVRRA